VQRLKTYKAKLVVFPRRARKVKVMQIAVAFFVNVLFFSNFSISIVEI
jgi:hypothetical protein